MHKARQGCHLTSVVYSCGEFQSCRDGVAPRPIIWDRLRSWASSVAKHYTPQQLSALGVHDVFGEVKLPGTRRTLVQTKFTTAYWRMHQTSCIVML